MSQLNAPSELTTARLLLRKPAIEDAQPLFDAYVSDPEIPRLHDLGGPPGGRGNRGVFCDSA